MSIPIQLEIEVLLCFPLKSGATPPPASRGPAAVLPNEPQRRAAMAGTSDVLSGTMQATAPFVLPESLVGAPVRTLAGLGIGTATGAAAKYGAEKAGLSPEAQRLAETAGFFIPAAAGVVDPRGMIESTPEGTRGAATILGGRAGVGAAVTPEAVTLRGKVGPFQGEKVFPRGPAAGPALDL
jgi:hypothetical protein